MISTKKLLKDLKFCQELMNRLVEYTENNYSDDSSWGSKRTVIQQDITRLRRELNEVNHKLDWSYKEK